MSARPEVALAPGTAFLGDLHLDVEDGAGVAAFEAALARFAGAPRLVFVGDVFEYWIGPAQGESAGGARALAALARLARGGTAIDVVPGNRDFLLERRFERASGAVVRERGFVGLLPGGERLLVVHGDELCTLDTGYLRLRAVLRSPPVRWLGPRLPAPLARAAARRLRRASRRALATKPRAEAEQQPDAVRALCEEARCSALLCGHAHRFRDEQLAGGPRWIVLDAWGDPRDVVTVGPRGELAATASAASGGAASASTASGSTASPATF